MSDIRRKIDEYKKTHPGVSDESVLRRLKERGIISSGGSGGSGSEKEGSTLDRAKETCVELIMSSPHYKDGFDSALLMAQNNIMKNNQDQLYFEACNLITNRPPGSNLSKVQLMNNLIQFSFGSKDQKITHKDIQNAGRFKHVLFLTIITHKVLLGNITTQDSTFNRIKDLANLSTGVLSAITKYKPSSKCKIIKVERKGASKILGNKTIYECSQEQWASVYVTFPETSLKRAVEKIVFDEIKSD